MDRYFFVFIETVLNISVIFGGDENFLIN